PPLLLQDGVIVMVPRCILLAAWLSLFVALGCNKTPPSVEVDPGKGVPVKNDQPVVKDDSPPDKSKVQEKHDALIVMALNMVADRKFPDALLILEQAQGIQDSDQVKNEIERVKSLMNQQKAADQTALDIQAVLNDGNADEAGKLATAALQQYGAGDNAP